MNLKLIIMFVSFVIYRYLIIFSLIFHSIISSTHISNLINLFDVNKMIHLLLIVIYLFFSLTCYINLKHENIHSLIYQQVITNQGLDVKGISFDLSVDVIFYNVDLALLFYGRSIEIFVMFF